MEPEHLEMHIRAVRELLSPAASLRRSEGVLLTDRRDVEPHERYHGQPLLLASEAIYFSGAEPVTASHRPRVVESLGLPRPQQHSTDGLPQIDMTELALVYRVEGREHELLFEVSTGFDDFGRAINPRMIVNDRPTYQRHLDLYDRISGGEAPVVVARDMLQFFHAVLKSPFTATLSLR